MLVGDDAEPRAATVGWRGATIDHVRAIPAGGPSVEVDADSAAGQSTGVTIDAAGALVLPGIVDLHGDAFERAIMPRAGVEVDFDLGLADNDAQLVAAGITTLFLSVTDSWEPGLRCRDTLRRLIPAIERRRGGPNVLLHVRHERCNTEDLDELIGWIESGIVAMLSYNDHAADGRMPSKTSGLLNLSAGRIERSGVDESAFRACHDAAVERRPTGLEQEVILAAVARAAGCPTASHDGSSRDDLARDLELGVGIAEFPVSISLANDYLDAGIEVLLGAPNLVRGGSHLGNLAVGDALDARAATILCSDYHYPSLLQAPFVHSARTGMAFGEAWALVAANAATAGGLSDRGRIEAGARADLVVVEPPADRRPATVRAMVVGGRVVGGTVVGGTVAGSLIDG